MVLSAEFKKNLILAMILPYTYGNIRDEQPVTGTTVWPDISAVQLQYFCWMKNHMPYLL